MKRKMLAITGLLLYSTTLPAFAVNTARVYKSGPLVLIFVGFFALLIIVQMLPALSTLYGLLKGIFSRRNRQETLSQTVSKGH